MILICKTDYDERLLEKSLSLCTKSRIERVNGLKNQKVRALSITAGLLMRYCLLKYGADPEKVKIHHNGKPYIEGEEIHFSLSHSGDYAACIVSKKSVGIDIQKMVKVSQRAIQRFSTANELKSISESAEPQKQAIKIWSLKESYLKASGCDTDAAFKAEFLIDENNVVFGPKGYGFEIFESPDNYITAVCKSEI